MTMEKFSALLAFCGDHQGTEDSPDKGPVIGIFDDFFVLSLNKLLN